MGELVPRTDGPGLLKRAYISEVGGGKETLRMKRVLNDSSGNSDKGKKGRPGY